METIKIYRDTAPEGATPVATVNIGGDHDGLGEVLHVLGSELEQAGPEETNDIAAAMIKIAEAHLAGANVALG